MPKSFKEFRNDDDWVSEWDDGNDDRRDKDRRMKDRRNDRRQKSSNKNSVFDEKDE